MKVVEPASLPTQAGNDGALISVIAASVMMMILAALMWLAFSGLFHS